MQTRGALVFDTEATGGVYIPAACVEDMIIYQDGDGSGEAKSSCRRLLAMFDLGVKHKEKEIKKVFGV